MAWCHPVLYQRLIAAKAKRGTRIVVIDPRRTPTCDEADLHLALRPGTDVALFAGLLTEIAARDAADRRWIARHTEGHAAALRLARKTVPSLAEAAAITDLPASALQTFYDWFAATERVVTLYSQGVNQSSAGTDKVNAIVNCHLATGRIGRPGMGPFSLTGQPNAMGGREVGGLANQLAAHMHFDTADIDRVRRFWQAPAIATRPASRRSTCSMPCTTARSRRCGSWDRIPPLPCRAPRAFARHWRPAPSSPYPTAGRPTRRGTRMWFCRPRAGAKRTAR